MSKMAKLDGKSLGGKSMPSVGKSMQRVDAFTKVTGKAKYVDDIFMPGMLYAKVLRSAIAHGWVKRIDVGRAKSLPGVEAVVTYEDVPKHTFPTAGHPYSKDPKHQDVADRHLLTRKIRLYGDEIAAVVACDELTAEKALSLIEIEYEESRPLLTTEDALKEGAEEIHDGTKNIIKKTGYRLGDLPQAFQDADFIFEGAFKTGTVQHCAMENHSAFAYIDGNGRIVIYSSTQIPHICRRIVGQALGIPWGRVRVIKPYIGGGFGSKQDIVVEPLAAFLTTVVGGRPVKLELTREETFIVTRVRHAIDFRFKTGVKKDGTITGGEMKLTSTNGGYASHGHSIAGKCTATFRQLYRQGAVSCEAVTVYTNTPAAGAMRGYGSPQLVFGLESHMDDIARQLHLDPVDFRLKNLHPPGHVDPLTGIKVHTNGLTECIAQGKGLIRWDEKKAGKKETAGTKRRGVGMACFSYGSGTYPSGQEIGGARIVLNQDGSVQLQVGATEIGQGSDTIFSQMAAETIGIPMEMVHLVTEQDTDVTPFDTGAYASRQTYISGMAVEKAAREIKAKVLDWAEKMTGIAARDLDISEAWIVKKAGGEKILSLEEVALESYYNLVSAAPITADVTNNARENALTFGCTFVEVEVDLATGKVEVLELYNIHDSGRVINPALAEGQVHGGVSMSLGYALYEQLIFDPKTGKSLNNNLLDYKLMTALDTPDIGAAFVETDEPTSPYGCKALGEPPTVSPAPAVRNAILDATGVAIYELPMTPQRLFEKFRVAGLV